MDKTLAVLKKIVVFADWIFSVFWFILAKIYDSVLWIYPYLFPVITALWLRLGRKRRFYWRFLDSFFHLTAQAAIVPLFRIIDKWKKLLDNSNKARAIFFIATPLMIIIFLWPVWNWGRWYVYQNGVASYYGKGFYFNRTANGELFLPGPFFTAAHNDLPFGTKVLVIDKKTGRSVVVRINDRGPFVGGRIIDLSVAAAIRLGIWDRGITEVTLYTRKPGSGRFFYYPFK